MSYHPVNFQYCEDQAKPDGLAEPLFYNDGSNHSDTTALPTYNKQPPLHPSKGTWFDPALDIRNPEGDCVMASVLDQLTKVDNRIRRRRSVDEIAHRTIVRKVLASGLRCSLHRESPLVAYCRRATSYRNEASWLSGRAIARTIDLLEKAGLVTATLGERDSASSTYSLTEAGQRLAMASGVVRGSLTLALPSERLLRVREGGRGTKQISFEPSDQTQEWIKALKVYNTFFASHDVRLAITPEEEKEWINHINENEAHTIPLIQPELFHRFLYRQFNNGDMKEGGRMYGGWWINVPRKFRPHITINGSPTVELDFSGCAIRILYNERGFDYTDDPYSLLPIAEFEERSGLNHGYYRDAIKRITQALINDQDRRGQPERVALAKGMTFSPTFKRKYIRKIIENKHTRISDAFGTGVGLRLQKIESDIALMVITKLIHNDILALPIHDSFIVKSSNIDILRSTMSEVYQSVLHHSPIIK